MKYYLVIATAIGILIVIIAGLWLAGSPQEARLARFDDKRSQDLATLHNLLYWHWNRHKDLPTTLTAIADTDAIPTDPETGSSYEYSRISSSTFSLCANFNVARTNNGTRPVYFAEQKMAVNFDHHDSGRVCFKETLVLPIERD